MEDFMSLDWDQDANCLVTFSIRNYKFNVEISDLHDVINEIREKSVSMDIIFDLNGVRIVSIDEFKQIAKLVQDVLEYTKDDHLLHKVYIKKAGFFFRLFYGPFSLVLPKQIREAITFV